MTKMKNVADIYPLTPTQQGMLYHSLTAPDSEVYFEQIRCDLTGEVDVAKLKTAWQTIVARHAVLRTAFLWDGLDTPLQVVRQTVTIPWQIHDWRAQLPVDEAQLDTLAAEYRQAGFDLAQAPLLKLVLVQLADNKYHFIWNFHHLLLDGWSAHQLFNEVFTISDMLVRGERLLRPRSAQAYLPPTRPFRNYLAWLKKQDNKVAEAYWREQLAGFEAPTPFHIDKRVTDTTVAYAEAKLNLTPELTCALQTMAQQQRLTLNTVVQGAWALLLSRYSGEDDVVFGATLAGRPADLPGVEQMVGMFINTLPVRAQIAADQPVVAWLRKLQIQQLEMRQYEYSPLVDVQKWSDVPAGQALFESIVVYENYPLAGEDEHHALQINNVQYREQSNYPLALLVLPREALQLLTIYNPNRFSADSIERLLGHLQTLLTAMAADPQQLVADIPLLTAAERQQVVVTWNNTAVPLEPQQCLHQFVTDHATQMPNATAVVAHDQRLTYAQLNTRANQLAHRLLKQGVTPGTPVGLFVERSMAMLIGIVGTLKAGGAYVPLDPDYPADRIEFVLADTQAPIIVTQSQLSNRLGVTDATIISLSDDFSELDLLPDVEPDTLVLSEAEAAVALEDLAYIIYTSGSTGKPKGVMVSHRNLLASTLARLDYYPERLQRFLLLSSFAFDSSLVGIFWTMLHGGTLVLPAADEEKDVVRLSALIAQEKVTHTLALPSLYQLLLTFAPNDSLNSLQAVIVAGEACPPDLGAEHYGRLPNTSLYNEYGPTEATVWCSVYRLPSESEAGSVPIGRPIANSQLLILDPHQQPLPIGVPGELYVGGAGVTQGYRNRPELTAKRFVKLPLDEFSGLFYRTGDLVRWRIDGQIEFLGRVDDQVKIRGYRIEPGEIEALLRSHPTVAETAVNVWERAANDKQLVAYVVADPSVNGNGIDVAALQAYLGKQLPEYMVPTHFVLLPQLPHTPNGKIDRRHLPEPSLDVVRERPFIAPRTEAEKTLARIWVDVLRLPQVSIEDKFFELGGDSIMSIRVIAKARQAGLKLTPRQMFNEQTIARLAAVATEAEQIEQVTATTSGRLPLTPIQHWFFEQQLANPHHWNQAQWFELDVAVNLQHLTTTLNHLIDHHAMLRTRFRQSVTGWQQEIVLAATPVAIKQVSLAGLTPSEQDAAMLKSAAELHATLNLTTGPLLAAAWFDLGSARKPRLLLSIHHLVVDAVSWGVLTADLATAYQQLAAGKMVVLPSVPTSFMQWSEALSHMAATKFVSEADFWLNKNMQPATNSTLPTDYYPTAEANSEGNAKFVSLSLDAVLTERLLRDANQTYHTRVDDLLLAALVQTAVAWIGSSALPVMLERHGREEIDAQFDVSQTVGWFTSLFPTTLIVAGDDLGANLRGIKEQLRRIPRNGLGYGVLRYLGDTAVQQQLTAQPQPQILFNYLGQKETTADDDSVLRPLPGELGPVYGLENKRAHLLDVNAWVSNGRLNISWQYPTTFYRPETIEQLAQTYIEELARLIDHCTGADKSQHTPSDFPLSKLEQTELDSLTDLLATLE